MPEAPREERGEEAGADHGWRRTGRRQTEPHRQYQDLVAAELSLHIPVSCVEASRWSRRSPSSPRPTGPLRLGPGAKLDQVSFAMRESGSREANQHDVWQDIDAKSRRMKAGSATQAAAARCPSTRGRSWMSSSRSSRRCPGQAGAVFTINGIVAGLDVFDSPATWRKSMRKLVQSFGLDALDHAEARGHVGASTGGSDATPQPEVFLSALKQAARERFPAIGVGEDVRIAGDSIVGGGLVVDGKVVHLVAFPA